MPKKQYPYLIRNIEVILIFIVFFKIGGYFSIVEEKSITQVFKIVDRMGMTIWIYHIYRKLKKYGCLSTFEYDGLLAPVLYGAYLLLGLASIGWSTDPGYSTIQWLMTFESFIFVWIFMRVVAIVNHHFPDKRINFINVFAKAIFPLMVIFIVGSFVEPDTFYRGMRGGEEKRLGGWIMNPNELGMLACIGASMSYLRLQQKSGKFWSILMMIASIVVLLMTSSRSSAIGFIVIIGLLVLNSNNKKLKIVMFGVILIAIPIFIDKVIFKDDGGVEEVMSMTGRLPFWTALLNEGIIKEPYLGYGFMRINYTDYFQGLNTYPGKMTHNTFMQVLMNLGFIGFFIAFWQLVSTIRNAVVSKKHPYAWFFLALFIPVLINSFTEFGIFGESNYGILFYQFLILLFVFKIRTKLTPVERSKRAIFDRDWGALIQNASQNGINRISIGKPEKTELKATSHPPP